SLEHPVDVVALPVPQAAELEHRCAVADLFHLRTAQVVLELWMPDQHDRQLPAAFGDEFDETFQRDESLGMEVVRVVNEQRHGLLGPPEQLLQIALAPLGGRKSVV